MSRRLLLLVLIFIPFIGDAQRKVRYKYELIGGLGVANFLGDLGGRDAVGTNGIRDLELLLTRPAVNIGGRYRLNEYAYVKSMLSFGMVRGDDKLTNEPFRRNRNLSFRSPIVELSVQFEASFQKEQQDHRYKIKNAKGFKNIDTRFYGFAGIGVFFFNPQAQYLDGHWTNLRKLGTEGQGILAGKEIYSPVNICIPLGIGARWAIDRFWGISVEVGMRKTFTDYIDDVSTLYATDTVTAVRGPVAGYFADPSQQQGPYPYSVDDGQQRGDPRDKDAYMFITVNVNYKMTYRKKTRSKF
ncbi:MAG: hypothetical protein AB1458_00260 [Bacteroidota bacterium]